LVIGTGIDAFRKLPEPLRDQLLLADLLILFAICDLMIGDFKSAEHGSRKSLETRQGLRLPEDLQMTNYYNYLGLACDSELRHDEARIWLDKSVAILRGHDEELYVRLSCQNNLNSARNLYYTDHFDEAEQRIDLSLKQATGFQSWCSLA
jgi:tetratricopeptide (TPR) repeat protein